MPEDEKNTPDETAEGQDVQPAGPVGEETSSSSQAAGEEATSPPPAGDTSEGQAESAEGEADEAPAESADAQASEDEQAPGSEAEAASEEVAAEPEGEKAEPSEKEGEKKKDVIPGADLEPIAVEPEAPALSAEEKARLEAEEEEKARREAELAGDEELAAASRAPAKMESGARYLATGKRKRSIARVTLVPGDGKFEVNKRPLEEFFPRPLHQTMARQPLAVSGYEGNVDVRVRVHGGGISGQAGAVRHGVARALTEIDAELRGDLKRRGFLTRDARVKERRKAGLKKARKRPQFSKR